MRRAALLLGALIAVAGCSSVAVEEPLQARPVRAELALVTASKTAKDGTATLRADLESLLASRLTQFGVARATTTSGRADLWVLADLVELDKGDSRATVDVELVDLERQRVIGRLRARVQASDARAALDAAAEQFARYLADR